MPVQLRNLLMLGVLLCAGFALLLAASWPTPPGVVRSSTSALPLEGASVARVAGTPGSPARPLLVSSSAKTSSLVNGPTAGGSERLSLPASEVGFSGLVVKAASRNNESSGVAGVFLGLALPVAMVGVLAAATARTRRRYSAAVSRLNETAETYYCLGGNPRSRLVLTAELDGPAVYRLRGETLDLVGKWMWGNLALSKERYVFSAANDASGLHLEALDGENAMTVVLFPSSARMIAQPLRGELNDLLRRWNDAITTVRSQETAPGHDESGPAAP